MPNQNALNLNDDESLDETNENRTTVVFVWILISVIRNVSPRILTSVPVSDQRTMGRQEWTNERIDELIQRPPDLRRTAITIADTLLFYLSIFLLPYYWYLLLCILIIYALTSINIQPGDTVNRSHLDASFDYAFNLHQDAEAEGRTAQPIDNDIEFSSTVEMSPPIQLSVENTQDHDLDAPTNLNNIRQTDPIDENPPNEEIFRSSFDRIYRFYVLMVLFNRIGNTSFAVESQDNIDSSDTSEEEDSSLSSEDGRDGDDESDVLDYVQLRDQVLPIPAVQLDSTENHTQSNQINLLLNSTTSTTGSNVPQNQAQDVNSNVHNPADRSQQLILVPSGGSTHVPVAKTHNRPQIHDESSDEPVS